ncbi:MAG: S-methyl-5-thioribose-1-phosphate isomerase [Elusimicrobia bacterium]|nr:S-methyl-5-thioribose-1-phosphate isomerase [Candidatus Liberimonas magnetica]
MIKTLYWKNGSTYILDQRLLPDKVRYIKCRTHLAVAKTIKEMAIRGAPAIGVAAAFGMALAANERKFNSLKSAKIFLVKAKHTLAKTRPTAVNLFWALDRMEKLVLEFNGSCPGLAKLSKEEALRIYTEDININKNIGRNGARLIKRNSRILTHCNAGALATAGYGTALGVIRSAFKKNKVKLVFVDETRPYLQGARLTAWELKEEKIPYVLITDNMAGYFMKKGDIDAVIVGADRIAKNGDTANKIGTYSLSVLAKHHDIPFYIAAPLSTIDFKTRDGSKINIEERPSKEVLNINKLSIAPKGAVARHPAFDVTPANYITAIITEKGVFKANELKKLA